MDRGSTWRSMTGRGGGDTCTDLAGGVVRQAAKTSTARIRIERTRRTKNTPLNQKPLNRRFLRSSSFSGCPESNVSLHEQRGLVNAAIEKRGGTKGLVRNAPGLYGPGRGPAAWLS